MARKRTLIPALPASSRTLDWVLIVAGAVLVVTWVVGGGDSGLWALGLVCIAVGGLLLLADRFGGTSRDGGDDSLE
ncbi:MAG: hypothetical protein WD557_07385 [Dehalococcoidia bacterium]